VRPSELRSPEERTPNHRPAAPRPEALSQVEGRLEQSGYSALRRVRCDFRDGVLRLRGHVPSHYLKQVAMARAAEVEGVRVIVNEIEVVRPPADGEAPERFAWAG
jgi:osmotically-inducible protein OsmY